MKPPTAKFQNKYRIASARLQDWDYGWNAAYFITICTKDRICYLGNVVNRKMELSATGIIADILWHEIIHHFGNVELGEFVVMPNHIHGILKITGQNDGDGNCGGDGGNGDGNGGGDGDGNGDGNGGDGGGGGGGGTVETTHALSLPFPSKTTSYKTIGQQRFQNQGKNTISSIIGSYKSAVSRHSHRLGFEFAWQSRFFDHVIRDGDAFQRISEYINHNPLNWHEDDFRVEQ